MHTFMNPTRAPRADTAVCTNGRSSLTSTVPTEAEGHSVTDITGAAGTLRQSFAIEMGGF